MTRIGVGLRYCTTHHGLAHNGATRCDVAPWTGAVTCELRQLFYEGGRVTVSFTVVGIPIPQGSKRAFKTPGGAVVMTEGATAAAAKRHKSWRAELTDAARAVAPPEPFAGPVAVTLRFRFLPVASDPYRTYHVSSPDIDKLARSVLDALKVARIVVDDSRVASLDAAKSYCLDGAAPGVDVSVNDLTTNETTFRRWKKETAAAARKAAKADERRAAGAHRGVAEHQPQ